MKRFFGAIGRFFLPPADAKTFRRILPLAVVALIVEIVAGIGAIDAGVGSIGIGAAACATGIGCPGGVAVAAGGVLVIGVGAVGVTQGAIGLGLNLSYLKTNNSGNGGNNNPFADNGIRTTKHFLDRLEDWGVSQKEAYSIYKNGTRYTDSQGRLIIWDPKKKLAIVVDSQDYGAITIFEQEQAPSSWNKGWIIPGK